MIALPIENAPFICYDLLMLGVALTLAGMDRKSAANAALTGTLFLLGTDDMAYIWQVVLELTAQDGYGWVWGLHPAMFVPIAVAEWLMLESRAVLRDDAGARRIRRLFRFSQVLAAINLVLWMWFWQTYSPEYTSGHVAEQTAKLELRSHTWTVVALVALAVPMLLLLLRRRDSQESIRLTGFMLTLPFYAAAQFSVGLVREYSTLQLVAIIVLFSTLMRFYRAQGRRGEFLSRFLSPQVGELVRERGLQKTLHPAQQEITVICCDLRGFTAYAQAHTSERVTQVLTDYYNAVCAEVARFGGTVKDFAGDGILVLMGAPLALPDHAQRGLDLARAMSSAARRAIAPYADPATPLGVGAGVASGRVTVGVIEAASRMEYAAVGPAMSVALRLCGRAKDGEILIDQRTRDLSGSATSEDRGALELKDVGEVAHYAMAAA